MKAIIMKAIDIVGTLLLTSIIGVAAGLLISLLWAFPIMILWNLVMVYQGLLAISFWQAWGMGILATLLIKYIK